ncbi:MAG: hypothetical protein Q4G33_02745, partial [bacterium]|nr:hypothetical protein [bacterium]
MDKKKLSSIVPGYNALRRVYLNFKYAYVYRSIKRSKRKNEKLTMVFLLNRTSIWNSLKPMYDAALADSNIKTYLVALPPYIKNKIDVDNNSSYEFCKKMGGNVINGYNAQTMEYVNLDKLNPDYIIIGIQYMSEYPECYSFDKLSKLAHICYFSYGYTMKKSKMQEITVQDPIMQFVSYIFACNDIMYGYYIKRMYLSERINGQRLYNIGFPRFDLYRNLK